MQATGEDAALAEEETPGMEKFKIWTHVAGRPVEDTGVDAACYSVVL